jgi:hypothetical protein
MLSTDDLPISCTPGATGGWPVDYDTGKLTFVDVGGYVLPNHAVKFIDAGAFELEIPAFVGEDVEVVAGVVPYPRVEKGRTSRLALAMNFLANPDGTGHTSAAAGWRLNWAGLCALAAPTLSSEGLQTVEYVPYVGASTYTFEAHVLPPVLGGDTAAGLGMTVGLVIEVPDPSTLPN